MEVEVYADLLFLINAGMDGLCLSMTARLLHRRVRGWRLAMGAVAGGVYAVPALLFDMGRALSLGADVVVCLGICALVFGRRDGRGRRGLLEAALVFTILSMVMGGVMTGLYSLFNRAGLAEILPQGGEGIGAWLFLLCSVIGSFVSMRGGRFCRRSHTVRLCRVSLEMDGNTLTVDGLTDSGNLLQDPIGGHPVICLSCEAAARILPPEMLSLAATGGAEPTAEPAYWREESPVRRRLRLIPASSATGDGLLAGFRPDKVILTPEGGSPRVTDAVIAVIPGPIRGGEAFGDIQALVPSELLS